MILFTHFEILVAHKTVDFGVFCALIDMIVETAIMSQLTYW